jgi:hypothetical protein
MFPCATEPIARKIRSGPSTCDKCEGKCVHLERNDDSRHMMTPSSREKRARTTEEENRDKDEEVSILGNFIIYICDEICRSSFSV